MNGSMQGLMSSMQQGGGPELGMEPPVGGGGGNADPAMLLTQAIQLHKRQAEGSVLTSPESHQELATLLESALAAITGGM